MSMGQTSTSAAAGGSDAAGMWAGWLRLVPVLLAGCSGPVADETRPLLSDKHIGSIVDLAHARQSHQLRADESFRITRLVEDDGQSALLVQVRGSLPPHFHQRTREVLYLLEGEGVLQLDAERIPIHAGAVVRIQPAQVHTFTNQGAAPAVFLVITAPRFDEADRIMVDAPP